MAIRIRRSTSSRAVLLRSSIAIVFFGAADILIVSTMVNRYWGESLLSTVGSRHTPLWLAWGILSVLLIVSSAFLCLGIRDLVRAIRDKSQSRRSLGSEHDIVS